MNSLLISVRLVLAVVALTTVTSGCRLFTGQKSRIAESAASPMAEVQNQKVKAALPKTAYGKLQDVLSSDDTIWYDHDSMKPSYQAAIQQSPPYGANANDKWFDLIADSVEPIARNFYDENKRKWRFPFGTTAGTDDSENMKVANFLSLPKKDGRRLPLAAGVKPQGISGGISFSMYSWGWVYPVGTMIGEVLFVATSTGELLPTEIRIRQRYASGWAVNVFRPFPSAQSLATSIKQKRPQWESAANLKTLVTHLESTTTLKPAKLSASQLPGVFDQEGALDELPAFGDESLVKELLTQTTFVTAYGETWKAGGGLSTFAPTTSERVSVVPDHYKGGMLAVNEASCMRCHKETGRHLVDFSPSFSSIVLYGEMWGRDGIFSFHPFDESKYDSFWLSGTTDNRALNPKLEAAGVIATYNPAVHKAPEYPTEEIGSIGTPPANPPQSGSGSASGGGGAGGGTPGVGGGSGSLPSKIVEFHSPAGTGSGEWNLRNSPVRVKPGQTVRIISDDTTGHVLHTDGNPCPHGDTSNPFTKGQYYDCSIPSDASSGTEYRLWDHFLGGPNQGRFWIKVE